MSQPESNESSAEATAARLLQAVAALAKELHPHGVAAPSVSLDSALDRDLGVRQPGQGRAAGAPRIRF